MVIELRKIKYQYDKLMKLVNEEKLDCFFAEYEVFKILDNLKLKKALWSTLPINKNTIKFLDYLIEEVENCHNNLIDLIAIEKNNLGGIHE